MTGQNWFFKRLQLQQTLRQTQRVKHPANVKAAEVQQRWSQRLLFVFYQLSIGQKLNVGFGVLVGLIFLVVGRNYWSSQFATNNINRTEQIRVPTVIASTQAQKELLEMSAHIRGYLITGKSEFRNSYYLSQKDFDRELSAMTLLLEARAELEGSALQDHKDKVESLTQLYQQWKPLPNELFALSDGYIDNQPALKLFADEGDLAMLTVLAKNRSLIQQQQQRSPSVQNVELLENLWAFQTSFSLLGTSLRAYLLTRSPDFRFEYAGQVRDNQQQWQAIVEAADQLSAQQQADFEKIRASRQQFLQLVPDLLLLVESEQYREDLYVFNTQAEPIITEMLALLNAIVESEQQLLEDELVTGKKGLITAQWQTALGSLVALLIALGMAWLLRARIADPIVRLTQATAQVTEGDFDTKAMVESKDEIGTLAHTFNSMTGYLKTLHQDLAATNTTLEKQKGELESKNAQIVQTLDALQNTQAQLIQTEKMAGLGQMVAGIAHEINNPTSFIQGNLPHAKAYATDLIELLELYQVAFPNATPEIVSKCSEIDLDFLKEDLPELFDSMNTGTQRIRDIVKSLRNFSRLDESDMKLAKLEEGLESTLLILQPRLNKQAFRPAVEVIKQYDNLPLIECYPGQLNQVFLNILSNAIDALDSASSQPFSQNWRPQLTLTTQLLPTHVIVSIRDNGEGIALATQSRIFDPFFTTKPVGSGTGMGLSVSHKIVVDRHQGDLSCESVPGEETTFTIKIPRQPVLS